MRKIALTSFLTSYNYGTLLQDYALAKKIIEIGSDCEYLNYQSHVETKGLRRLLGKIKRIIFSPQKKYTGIDDFSFWYSSEFYDVKRKCDDFIKYLIPKSKKYYPNTIQLCNESYDKFIVGSDQTWSPHIINETSPFLLGFVKNDKVKASYAPSLGTLNIPKEFQNTISRYLKDFSYITCRERANAKLLSELTGKNVRFVLDPTLLLTMEQWLDVANPVELPNEYVLCYILGEKECISEFAESLGKKKGIPVYYIMTRPFYYTKKNLLRDLGPSEFVYALSQATYVVTDSFHGSIFSINFKKQFFTFSKREITSVSANDNDRIMEILNEFELIDRYYEDDALLRDDVIDYRRVYDKLLTKRAESEQILKQIIEL